MTLHPEDYVSHPPRTG